LSGVVVDASVALAWCFPDEASEYADAVLMALEGETILVPVVWALEVANGVLVGERSKRLRQPEIRRFAALLGHLPIIADAPAVGDQLNGVLPLAREYGLSAYDAAYLELSVRHNASIATLDARLRTAAKKAGVDIFMAVP
jgi:predicted nucleic acid-binding protein